MECFCPSRLSHPESGGTMKPFEEVTRSNARRSDGTPILRFRPRELLARAAVPLHRDG
jgi:hypothetical protein